MFDRRRIVLLAAEYVQKNQIPTKDHHAVERALLRIAPEVHEMDDEIRRELVAAIVTACESAMLAS
jgi:hypothetical protein